MRTTPKLCVLKDVTRVGWEGRLCRTWLSVGFSWERKPWVKTPSPRPHRLHFGSIYPAAGLSIRLHQFNVFSFSLFQREGPTMKKQNSGLPPKGPGACCENTPT